MRGTPVLFALLCAFLSATVQAADPLPAGYFRLLEAGAAKVERHLDNLPGAGLKEIEAQPYWRHFPYAILAPAVLYAKTHRANIHYHDATIVDDSLVERIRRQGVIPTPFSTYVYHGEKMREYGADRLNQMFAVLKGWIEPGTLADLVVLGRDPLREDPFSLIRVPVERTMVGGRWVFEA